MAEEVRKPDHEVPNLRDATSNMMTKTATSLSSKQDSSPGSWLTTSDERIRELGILLRKDEETLKALKNMKRSLRAANISESMNQLQERMPARAPSQTEEMDTVAEHRAEAIESRSATDRGLVGPQQRRISNCSKEHSKIHNFYTKASILSPRGIVGLERVQVDERSSFNLLPLSIAMDLDLALYPDRVLTITVANCRIQTNQYCRFTIRVAGFDTTINTGVISGLQTILLGRGWIQSVKLLSDFGNRSYYIPVPLAVEAAGERFPDLVDAEVEAQNIELVETAMTNKISEEYDGDECSNVDCGDDPLSDSELSPCELSSEDERSLGDDLSGDELSEISSGEELNFGEYELVQTDEDDGSSEDDGGSEDYEDYEDYEGEECNECEEDEEYEEYDEEGQECQECQKGEDDTDASLQDFMKQHKHLEHAEPQRRKDARETAKLEPEPELHRPTCLKNPFGRNDEPGGDPAFNISSQQAESKDERVSTATVFRPC
jgi:hypothetical protein